MSEGQPRKLHHRQRPVWIFHFLFDQLDVKASRCRTFSYYGHEWSAASARINMILPGNIETG
jgi:hypothetical protein